MRILVTGSSGLLGPYVVEALSSLGDVFATARDQRDLRSDLTNKKDVAALLEKTAPDIVVHLAALTDVDRCEKEPVLAEKLNVHTSEILINELPKSSKMVLFSTDQVYPDVPGLHQEGTEAPVNVYGRTKLAAERAVSLLPNNLILRTNFFGASRSPGRESLSDFVVGKLSKEEEITLFEDIYFSPLHMSTLASLTVEAIDQDLRGTFNVGSRGGMSKKDFALTVARKKGLGTKSAKTGRSSELADRAPRPSDLRMDVSRFEKAMKISLPGLEQEISKMIECI